jgi:hypothetical protein
MSEWLKEHAWKLNLLARADAHQIPPTHFRFNDFRYIDVRRCVPVNEGITPGFRGVCDTVLTQEPNALRAICVCVRPYARPMCSTSSGPVSPISSTARHYEDALPEQPSVDRIDPGTEQRQRQGVRVVDGVMGISTGHSTDGLQEGTDRCDRRRQGSETQGDRQRR